MALAAVSLDDKYALESGRVYLTGIQALVRLPLMQRKLDQAAGLNTAGFISGYRGSPLGGYDQALWKARQRLKDNDIVFQPGVNEDLGATAVWGSQQIGLWPGAKYDGVFSIWYGKGPGVDRSGDVLKHGNAAGSARHGGVLVLAGDDHACKSSTFPHQSEHAFLANMIPVLNPAGVQEILDYGLVGWAMSRYSGCWIAMKTIAETVDSSASVVVDPHRVSLRTPEDFDMPPGGLNIRWPDPPLEQEHRLMRHKLYAALAFARANRLDRVVMSSPKRRFGVVTTGKSYLDVRQALDDLGITEAKAKDIGLSLYKVAMTWPLEREGVRHFAEGLDEIVVVEEKRALVENQLKEQLYNWRPEVRPTVVGKFDEKGDWILPSTSELSPAQIAVVVGKRLLKYHQDEDLAARVAFLERQERQKTEVKALAERKPIFCSGCPHNTSTNVPEGSRALAGIGCHYMANWMDRRTDTFSQMGGEGVPWVGQAPFVETPHVFVNLGDGTYYHSGILAIRQAIAAGVNVTYKLLFNDAVAMTGGQPVDGPLSVPQITHQLAAEGVGRIVVMSDEPEKYDGVALAGGARVEHRDALEAVQKELRETPGVTILVYDQTCAAEKRRRRKRGLMADPPKRVIINEMVCEGCGDCSKKSNCVSVVPVDTEYGRKRAIDQSSCNKDFSCLKGFCPSFVTVHGGKLRKPKPAERDGFDALSEPTLPALDQPYGLLVTGVGGTGVVTIGALLGMAAHIEGKGCSVLDMTGLAQKGGAVTSHVRIAAKPDDIHAVRIAAGGARVVLGCDLVVAAGGDAESKMAPGVTHAILNSHELITSEFTKKPDFRLPTAAMIESVKKACGGAVDSVDATGLAAALMGDAIAANLFMLGYAYQKGLVPVSAEAIERAIELNGVAIDMNKGAFLWGRRAAHDLEAVRRAAAPRTVAPQRVLSQTLDETIERRAAYLVDYQDEAYARRYRDLIARVREAEAARAPGRASLTDAVARNYFKVLAYKDEYEVARLYTDGGFLRQVQEQFEGDYKLEFHLAPPMVAEIDPNSGEPKKRTYGPWMLRAMGVLARMKRLRGTRLDVFGRSPDRQLERKLIAEYEAVVAELLRGLNLDNHALAVEIAALPDRIRGFGPIKERGYEAAKAKEAELLAAFRNPAPHATAAE